MMIVLRTAPRVHFVEKASSGSVLLEPANPVPRGGSRTGKVSSTVSIVRLGLTKSIRESAKPAKRVNSPTPVRAPARRAKRARPRISAPQSASAARLAGQGTEQRQIYYLTLTARFAMRGGIRPVARYVFRVRKESIKLTQGGLFADLQLPGILWPMSV